jgi:hypothetical protein
MMSTIEMNDFTVRVKNLPLPSRYQAKDIILKVLLHEHFAKLVKHLKKDQTHEWDDIFDAVEQRETEKKNALNPIIDEPQDGEISDPDEMIAEISFGKNDM